MVRRTIVLALSILFAISLGFSQEKSKQSAEVHIAQVLQTTIQNFFEGKNTKSIITFINDGEFNESIPDPEKLKETYADCEFVFFKAFISTDMHTAVMTLKTSTHGSERWHTFVLMTNAQSETKWEVKSWHSSHS